MNTITIAQKTVGEGFPPFLIAEIAQAHDGSLGMAHAYIEAVAQTGADAIKFQTHIAEDESTLDEPFRKAFTTQDATRYAYWKRMEFTEAQWLELANHAREKGLIFLSSPFSLKAVEWLRRIGMPAWKVGSGEFASEELLSAMGNTGAPILFSTGMCSYAEIADITAWFEARQFSYALFQCTSKYPVALEEVGLNVLDELRARFRCPVGLSDHSGSLFPGLAALARGVNLFEAHVTFDRRMFGPDVPASLTIDEFKLLADARDAFTIMRQHPVDKDVMAGEMTQMRRLFTKSVAPVCDLSAGTVLTDEMLCAKKPGTGIPYREKDQLIGRTLIGDVKKERLLRWEDIRKK